jgi:transcriptional regulator with XRE-family HTH domain
VELSGLTNKASDTKVFRWLREAFSSRLTKVLVESGYETTKPLRVDVARFAREIGCSATMLRRYLNGVALPSEQIIEKMATLLNVDPVWLFCGRNDGGGVNLDYKLLKTILHQSYPCFAKSELSYESFCQEVERVFTIYEQLRKIDATTELEKEKFVSWMLSNMMPSSTST